MQGIRVPDERWKNLGEAAKKAGTDRSKIVNDFAKWFTREDDTPLPERPDVD